MLIVVFYLPHSFYSCYLEFSGKGDLSLLFHLFTLSLIFKYHLSHVYLFYSLGYNAMLCYFIYFVAQTGPDLAIRGSFRLALVSLWHAFVCSFCEYSLAFWHKISYKLILYFSCPDSTITNFSKVPWFLLLESII